MVMYFENDHCDVSFERVTGVFMRPPEGESLILSFTSSPSDLILLHDCGRVALRQPTAVHGFPQQVPLLCPRKLQQVMQKILLWVRTPTCVLWVFQPEQLCKVATLTPVGLLLSITPGFDPLTFSALTFVIISSKIIITKI